MPDVLIVGGGLAGSLAAWHLLVRRPDVSVTLLEAGDTLGGNHTWSFHETDLDADARAWIAPLPMAAWPAHSVRFPDHSRQLHGGYASISSARLHAVVGDALGPRLRCQTQATVVTPTSVTLASGACLQADVVIDARGAVPSTVPTGWQTFVGHELQLPRPHGLREPVLMDATVPQVGGYRFVYVLPFSEDRLLVEDTWYADTPLVPLEAGRRAIQAYAQQQGWSDARCVREEVGSLPIPLGGDIAAFWPDRQPRLGLRGGFFHPTTGYSLADAVATARLLATLPLTSPEPVGAALHAEAARRWRQRRFLRLLNRLLFRAAAPDQRVRVLSQFYTRSEPLIARFYGARLTAGDRLRVLAGRPPVSLWRALPHLLEVTSRVVA